MPFLPLCYDPSVLLQQWVSGAGGLKHVQQQRRVEPRSQSYGSAEMFYCFIPGVTFLLAAAQSADLFLRVLQADGRDHLEQEEKHINLQENHVSRFLNVFRLINILTSTDSDTCATLKSIPRYNLLHQKAAASLIFQTSMASIQSTINKIQKEETMKKELNFHKLTSRCLIQM